MYDSALQARFAKSCFDAMLGYMTATTAASVAATGQVLDLWADAARTMSGADTTSRRGGTGQATHFVWPMAQIPTGPEAMFPWLRPSAYPATHMLNPMDLWLSMTPFGRSPMVLQMAAAMMAVGVPRTVAMPTAEANASAFDAAETAANMNFSSYRSDGGHASAQITFTRRMAAALMLSPLGATAIWPWITSGPRGYGF